MNRHTVIILFFLLLSNLALGQNREESIRQIDSLNNISYEKKILTDSSNLDAYLTNLEKSKQISYQKGIADSYSNIGMIYFYQGKYDLSRKYFFNAINVYEEIELFEPAANLYSLYGYSLRDRDIEKSAEFMLKGIKMAEKLNSSTYLLGMYDNYGLVKETKKEYDSAFYYFNKSLSMKKKIRDKVGIPYSLNKIATLNIKLGDFNQAKKNLDQAYQMRLELNDQIGIAENLNFYGLYYEAINNDRKALEYFEKALIASKNVGYPNLIQRNFKSLSEILEKNHDYRNALYYFKQHAIYKDSLTNIQVMENRNRLEVEFETEKKEREILVQRAEIAEKKLQIEKKNLQIMGVVFLLVIFILVGIQLYNRQVQKNIQLKKENQLKDALAKIEIQNRLQDQRLRISRDLHDNIGSQLTFIISSIDNLKYQLKDQNPKIEVKLNEINSFTRNTIVELRDTIWAMNKDYISYEDLKIRLNNFIEKAESLVSEIDFSFYIDEVLMERQMNAFEGINIYRIIQEGINNAIKHAQATQISVKINELKNTVKITIEDNGKGFDVDTNSQGNGLTNIRKRLEDISGTMTVVSSPEKGTQLSVIY